MAEFVEGNSWNEFLQELSEAIVYEELITRYPEIGQEEKRRDSKYP